MSSARTVRITGWPRRPPTREAGSPSAAGCPGWRCPRSNPSLRIESTTFATVPWYSRAGGTAGVSCRSTSTEWPWLARIRRPSGLSAKRCLSDDATSAASSARLIATPWAAHAASRPSTSVQPASSSSMPMRAGSWRSTSDRNLETRADILLVSVGHEHAARVKPRSGSGRQLTVGAGVDAMAQVLADGHRLADDLPHVLERVDPRAPVVGPLDADLGDRVAGAPGEREDLEIECPAVDLAAAEQIARRLGGERLEAALRVVDARNQRALDDLVGEPAPQHAVA